MVIRSSPARRRPMFRIWPAPPSARQWRPLLPPVRHSQRPHRRHHHGHGRTRPFEFQRLHGMGEALYASILKEQPQLNCRVYAPLAATRSCSPIWCGGCWRMAPTARL